MTYLDYRALSSVRLASDEVDHSLYGIRWRAHCENKLLYGRKEPSLFVPFEKVVLVDAYRCLYRRQVS